MLFSSFLRQKSYLLNFRQHNRLHLHRTGALLEIHNEGAAWGVWGRSPQRSKILHLFAKITKF